MLKGLRTHGCARDVRVDIVTMQRLPLGLDQV
jgi:hypothetical protein